MANPLNFKDRLDQISHTTYQSDFEQSDNPVRFTKNMGTLQQKLHEITQKNLNIIEVPKNAGKFTVQISTKVDYATDIQALSDALDELETEEFSAYLNQLVGEGTWEVIEVSENVYGLKFKLKDENNAQAFKQAIEKKLSELKLNLTDNQKYYIRDLKPNEVCLRSRVVAKIFVLNSLEDYSHIRDILEGIKKKQSLQEVSEKTHLVASDENQGPLAQTKGELQPLDKGKQKLNETHNPLSTGLPKTSSSTALEKSFNEMTLSNRPNGKVRLSIDKLAQCEVIKVPHYEEYNSYERSSDATEAREGIKAFLNLFGRHKSNHIKDKDFDLRIHWELDTKINSLKDDTVYTVRAGSSHPFVMTGKELKAQANSLVVTYENTGDLDATTLQKLLVEGAKTNQGKLAHLRCVSSDTALVNDAFLQPLTRRDPKTEPLPTIRMLTASATNYSYDDLDKAEEYEAKKYEKDLRLTLTHIFKHFKETGVDLPVLPGFGLGVFIPDENRLEASKIFAHVLVDLLQDKDLNFKGVVFADPNPKLIHVINQEKEKNKTVTPLITYPSSCLIFAQYAATNGYYPGVLNPGDPRGMPGENWESGHIALEELMGLSTTLVPVQHPGANTLVADQTRYIPINTNREAIFHATQNMHTIQDVILLRLGNGNLRSLTSIAATLCTLLPGGHSKEAIKNAGENPERRLDFPYISFTEEGLSIQVPQGLSGQFLQSLQDFTGVQATGYKEDLFNKEFTHRIKIPLKDVKTFVDQVIPGRVKDEEGEDIHILQDIILAAPALRKKIDLMSEAKAQTFLNELERKLGLIDPELESIVQPFDQDLLNKQLGFLQTAILNTLVTRPEQNQALMTLLDLSQLLEQKTKDSLTVKKKQYTKLLMEARKLDIENELVKGLDKGANALLEGKAHDMAIKPPHTIQDVILLRVDNGDLRSLTSIAATLCTLLSGGHSKEAIKNAGENPERRLDFPFISFTKEGLSIQVPQGLSGQFLQSLQDFTGVQATDHKETLFNKEFTHRIKIPLEGVKTFVDRVIPGQVKDGKGKDIHILEDIIDISDISVDDYYKLKRKFGFIH